MARYHFDVEVVVESESMASAEDLIIPLLESKGFNVSTGLANGYLKFIAIENK